MARPELLNHRKFRRLINCLGVNGPTALGHLEWLWQGAYKTGDPYLGDSLDVELAAGWEGESGKLTEALLEAGGMGGTGFIEPAPEGGYQIHDLLENAPSYVKDRFRKRLERSQTRPGKAKKDADVSSQGVDTSTPAEDNVDHVQDSPGQSGISPERSGNLPEQSGSSPGQSALTESHSPNPDSQKRLESDGMQEPPGTAEPTQEGDGFEGKDEPGNPPNRKALHLASGSRKRGLQSIGEHVKSITEGLPEEDRQRIVLGFLRQHDDWLLSSKCPGGLTDKQIRSLLSAGLTLEGACKGRSKYLLSTKRKPAKAPGALAYKLLEDQLNPDAARDLRAKVASTQRDFRERHAEGK